MASLRTLLFRFYGRDRYGHVQMINHHGAPTLIGFRFDTNDDDDNYAIHHDSWRTRFRLDIMMTTTTMTVTIVHPSYVLPTSWPHRFGYYDDETVTGAPLPRTSWLDSMIIPVGHAFALTPPFSTIPLDVLPCHHSVIPMMIRSLVLAMPPLRSLCQHTIDDLGHALYYSRYRRQTRRRRLFVLAMARILLYRQHDDGHHYRLRPCAMFARHVLLQTTITSSFSLLPTCDDANMVVPRDDVVHGCPRLSLETNRIESTARNRRLFLSLSFAIARKP